MIDEHVEVRELQVAFVHVDDEVLRVDRDDRASRGRDEHGLKTVEWRGGGVALHPRLVEDRADDVEARNV